MFMEPDASVAVIIAWVSGNAKYKLQNSEKIKFCTKRDDLQLENLGSLAEKNGN